MIAREQLERELRELSAAIEWPPTPDLAAAVAEQLRAPAGAPGGAGADPARRRTRRGWGAGAWLPRSPLAIAATALLALLVAVALVPPARSAVLRVLGFTGSARIVRVPGPPPVPPPPTTSERQLNLGRPTSLADARRRAGFRVRLPASLGPPRRVRFSTAIAGGAVTLSWPGFVLTEMPGATRPFIQKLADASHRVRHVTIGDASGFFLSGPPHYVVVSDRNGQPVFGTPALVHADVLLWDAAGISFRLETRRSLDAALAVARSIR